MDGLPLPLGLLGGILSLILARQGSFFYSFIDILGKLKFKTQGLSDDGEG